MTSAKPSTYRRPIHVMTAVTFDRRCLVRRSVQPTRLSKAFSSEQSVSERPSEIFLFTPFRHCTPLSE